MSEIREIKIGLVSISDRASKKVYEDLGLPNLKDWLSKAIISPWRGIEKLVPDEKELSAFVLFSQIIRNNWININYYTIKCDYFDK